MSAGGSEKERLRAILDTALDAIINMDGAGRITGWNAQAEVMFGWPAEQVLGRPLADTIIPPRYRDAHRAGLAKYLATGEGPALNRRLELLGLRRDGEEFPIELSIAPLRGAGPPLFSGFVRDITASKRAEAELRDRQAYLDGLFEGAPEGIVIVKGDRTVHRLNRAFARLFGYSQEAIVGRKLDELIVPAERSGEADGYWSDVQGGRAIASETVRCHRDGHEIPVSVLCFPVPLASGEVASYGIYRDSTERLRLEAELLHGQKMDSIGRLAGGVAHDFNNILTAILGYLDAAREAVLEGQSPLEDLGEVDRAARRAAELTRQLLGFARRQITKPQIVDLNALIGTLESLLGRLLGEDVEITLQLAPGLGVTRLDPSQFEQIVVNLAVNARHAMPEGGRLTLETREVELTSSRLPVGEGLLPGWYVELRVSDTGVGMDPAIMHRIFEPFFTTKPVGAGTGLGLATCYGIVRQSGGFITVESEQGSGTTFHVHFPRIAPEVAAAPARSLDTMVPGGSETILVVEDESRLRDLFLRILVSAGYAVLVAGDGEEALRVQSAHAGTIDLLLTDVVLPKLGGRALAEQLVAARPGLRVLYVSGYTEDPVVERGVLEGNLDFIAKPFDRSTLLTRVRELLDRA